MILEDLRSVMLGFVSLELKIALALTAPKLLPFGNRFVICRTIPGQLFRLSEPN